MSMNRREFLKASAVALAFDRLWAAEREAERTTGTPATRLFLDRRIIARADGQPRRVVDKAQWVAEGGEANSKLVHCIFSATSPDGVTWDRFHRVVAQELPPGKKQWTPGAPGWAGGDNFPCLLYAPERRKW